MKILFSSKCLEFEEPGHPESPSRVKACYEFLKKQFDFIEPEPCSDKDLLLVHDKRLVESVKNNAFVSGDSPNLPNIYNYARLAAGSAIKAMELALKNELACGGTFKDNTVELQGDHRKKIKPALVKLGFEEDSIED